MDMYRQRFNNTDIHTSRSQQTQETNETVTKPVFLFADDASDFWLSLWNCDVEVLGCVFGFGGIFCLSFMSFLTFRWISCPALHDDVVIAVDGFFGATILCVLP